MVRTTGVSNSSQYIRFGGYTRIDTYFDRPVYVHEAREEFLFYMAGRSRGLWMIGPEVGQFSGGLANRADDQCPQTIGKSWKYADGTGWSVDPDIQIQCLNNKPGRKTTSTTYAICNHFIQRFFSLDGTYFISD